MLQPWINSCAITCHKINFYKINLQHDQLNLQTNMQKYLTSCPVWYFMESRKSLRPSSWRTPCRLSVLFDAWSCGWLYSVHVTPTDGDLSLHPPLLNLHIFKTLYLSLCESYNICTLNLWSIVFPAVWVLMNSTMVGTGCCSHTSSLYTDQFSAICSYMPSTSSVQLRQTENRSSIIIQPR